MAKSKSKRVSKSRKLLALDEDQCKLQIPARIYVTSKTKSGTPYSVCKRAPKGYMRRVISRARTAKIAAMDEETCKRKKHTWVGKQSRCRRSPKSKHSAKRKSSKKLLKHKKSKSKKSKKSKKLLK